MFRVMDVNILITISRLRGVMRIWSWFSSKYEGEDRAQSPPPAMLARGRPRSFFHTYLPN